MNLNEFIYKRKSTRKYDMTPLDNTILDQITDFASKLKALDPSIKTSYELTSDAKNLLPVNAPYYFMISSEKTGDYLENIGFMWQQMDLYLSSLGLGSCWLGMAKPTKDTNTKYAFVIALAFGKPQGSCFRELNEFKRKSLSEISSGIDVRLEAARLAPSATNSQNWYFQANSEGIDCFQKKVNPLLVMMYEKMNRVDMGIALCHLYYATLNLNKEFKFEKLPNKTKKGYMYLGSIR